MLLAVVVEIVSKRSVSLPSHLGRANHAAILHQIATVDPALSRRIHDSDTAKPLTCSSILGAAVRREGLWVDGGRTYALRFTGLSEEVSEAMKRCLVESTPDAWILDEHLFRVEDLLLCVAFKLRNSRL